MPDGPEFQMTNMREAAVGLHEVYTEFRAAGFSRSEAMEIVTKMMANAMNLNNGSSEGE